MTEALAPNVLVTKRPVMPSRPKRSLHHKMMWWVVIGAVVPTVICMVLFNVVVRRYLIEQRSQDGYMLAEMVAASLAGRVSGGWGRSEGDLVDSLGREPRVAFVCVVDANGSLLHVGVFDADAWDVFQKHQVDLAVERTLKSRQVGSVQLRHNLVLHTVHIRQLRSETGEGRSVKRDIEGTVVLALHNPVLYRTLEGFQAAQVATVVVVCLVCLPIHRAFMRKWMRPLGELVMATRRLAEGRPPEPVTLASQDELGFLAGAFNDMAGKLIKKELDLIEANTSLEQRVKERTRDLMERERQLHEANRKLDEMASTDPLTGLANRRIFDVALEQRFAESVRDDTDLTCVMIDLDYFKRVNDTFGHQVGDEVLLVAARVIKECGRESDIAGRQGGDEFVILMPDTNETAAQQPAERLIQQFHTQTAELLARFDTQAFVTMSMGMASRKRTDPATGQELLLQADKALYAAKESGKACLESYDKSAA